ncbi:MAG: purine-nucleoside phosphorylase [Oscillospiraceae bacterium]
MTPHNRGEKGDIAKTVLMPGDPLRAKFIAETYLKNPRCFNTVRNMLGYTGEYRGAQVSVMGSGMGIPSLGIYSYELFHFYDVQNIIRIGSAGGVADGVKLRDIAIGMGACTDSNFGSQFHLPGTFAPIASYTLLEKAVRIAKEQEVSYCVGNLLSSDVFYGDYANSLLDWSKMGVLAVEMEAAGLYMNAARAGKNALALATISDLPLKGEATTPEERQTSFTQMMEIALQIAVEMDV